jgi:protein-glucosylgalactosylhydroxylysine glucosidase
VTFGEPAITDRVVAVAGSLLLGLAVSLNAQDTTFILATADPTYRTPTFLGNGAFSLVTTPLGTAPALSFAAGVYDHTPDDVPRIAALPVWNEINVFDGHAWLNEITPDTGALQGYRQTVDLYDGVVRTNYDWVDGARRTRVAVEALVSRADPELAAVRLVLAPHDSGRVTVVLPLRPRTAPARLALARLEHTAPDWTLAQVWYPGHVAITSRGATADELWLEGRTAGRGTVVALAARVGWPAGQQALAVQPTISDSGVALAVTFRATAQAPLTVYKYVGVAASRAAAARASRRGATQGYDALRATHRAAWHRMWETDVVVTGDPELQRIIHAMLFDLVSSVRAERDVSIPPMGLSSAGYYGHVFWDADTWMFPPLVLLHPTLARSMVTFRARVLPAARRNAHAHGYRGAMYPWESDELGEETTPRFAWQNAQAEIHVTGDVALAQWQYYLATGDSAWLARVGEPVIRATADFWASRATYDTATGRYAIRNVVSVDEGLIGIGNDAYTNAVARRNLEIAVNASRRIGHEPNPRWTRVAERLAIPYDSVDQYHPTYEGAPPETRGSVVPLLAYPLALPMSPEAKRHDLEHAVRRLLARGSGAMMTTTLYPVIAAELGDRTLVDTLLPLTYRGHVRPPFDALAETPDNDAVNFVTGAGGFLQQIVYGYTGLRLDPSGVRLAFRPVLPSRLTRLVLQNASVRGRRYDIVVERDTTRFVAK